MSDHRVRILTRAYVPDEAMANAWLQHMRDFDTAHPGCHFEILIDSPDTPLDDVMEMLKVDPPLPVVRTMKRGEE